MPTNDALNKRLLRRGGIQVGSPLTTLLEQLCTDSVYTLKDDFDRGLDENLWISVASEASGARAFEPDGGINGWISGDPGGRDDANIWLASNEPIWSPARRCSVQVRFSLPTLTSIKLEFGFVNPTLDPTSASINGAVNVKDTPTAQSGFNDFGVCIYDTDDDTSTDLVLARRGTVTKVTRAGGADLSAGEHSLMVSMSENGETRYWIDGVDAGFGQIAPVSTPAFNGTLPQTAPVTRAVSQHGDDSGHYIWFYLQNRAANVNHVCRIDYIQAWQERSPVD